MIDCVNKNPESLAAYLSVCYLLMNLLVEEDYENSKHDYYAKLLKHYFDESYFKFLKTQNIFITLVELHVCQNGILIWSLKKQMQ